MAVSEELLKILVCPVCKGKLEVSADEAALVCNQCRLVYPVENDIPALMVSAAKKLD